MYLNKIIITQALYNLFDRYYELQRIQIGNRNEFACVSHAFSH